MPSFFNDGNTPARSDGMWKIEQKILGALIANGSGSGSSDLRAGNYAGGEPNFTPSGTAGAAIDTSDDHIWWYYGGAWH